MSSDDLAVYRNKLNNFALIAMFIMGFLIHHLSLEDRRAIQSLNDRYYSDVPAGEHMATYITKFSLVSNCLLFWANFSIALIYCQIVESSIFEIIFLLPMVLQLIICLYLSKILGIQLRIVAVNQFATLSTQSDYLSWYQVKICK